VTATGYAVFQKTGRCIDIAPDTCKSFDDCDPGTYQAKIALACFANTYVGADKKPAPKTCAEAVSALKDRAANKGIPISPSDERATKDFYHVYSPHDESCMDVVPGYENNWARTAVWMEGTRHYALGGKYRWGVQIMPSIGIGIPFAISNSSGDTAKALQGTRTVGGVLVRLTPFSFYASLVGFLGTSDVGKDVSLDTKIYPSPAMLLYGGGIDILGGALSLTYVHAMLRTSGLLSPQGDATNYVQFGIDLTAFAIGTTGALNGSVKQSQ
jgi:hypothetical protein